MKKHWKYIAFVLLLFGVWVLYFLGADKQFNWLETYYHRDKNPFGAYLLDQVIQQSWSKSYEKTNQTVFELTEWHEGNLLILASNYFPQQSERDKLIRWIEEGNRLLLCAHNIDSAFGGLFGFETDHEVYNFNLNRIWSEDSIYIRLNDDLAQGNDIIQFPEEVASGFFKEIDDNTTTVLATNDKDQPVAIAVGLGEGLLVVTTMPLAFTNYGLLISHGEAFVASLFSTLTDAPLVWTEYYQLGRRESESPLRYIISNRSLRAAFGVLMCMLVLMIVFDSKRRQRVIPPEIALKNTSLEFVKTIGSLYYQQGDHRDLALKKVLFFTEYLKQHFYINPEADISGIIEKLSEKTGIDNYEIKVLFEEIQSVYKSDFIGKMDLLRLNNRIDNIYRQIEESYKK